MRNNPKVGELHPAHELRFYIASNPSKAVKYIIWLINLLIFNSNNIKLAKKWGEILSLCNGIRIFKIGLWYSFISTRRQRSDLFVFQVNLLLPVESLVGRGNGR